MAYNYNSPVPNCSSYIDKPRPFPNLPDITYVTNGAGHQYNGLTVEAQAAPGDGAVLPKLMDLGAGPLRHGLQLGSRQRQFTSEDPTIAIGKSVRRRTFRRTVGNQLHLRTPIRERQALRGECFAAGNLAAGRLGDLSGIFT